MRGGTVFSAIVDIRCLHSASYGSRTPLSKIGERKTQLDTGSAKRNCEDCLTTNNEVVRRSSAAKVARGLQRAF